jgi:predicted AlkP superfamily phosphohydrolase/phosphomutase
VLVSVADAASNTLRGGPPVSRAIVIGWDGATWSVADPLSKAGRLPTLTGLRKAGAEGVLETVPNMNSAPAWSTVATGLNPGRHGIFYFDEPVPGTYRRRVVNASRRSGASLWRMVSEAGRRVVVVSVPISYPAEPVNGYVVAGLDTPSKSLPGFTHPADLPRRFAPLFESYALEVGAPGLMRAGRVEEARSMLLSCIDGWTAVTERLMEEEWDLVFVVLTSTDTAQHFFWTDEGRRTVERVYEATDEATARLVEKGRAADPDVNVLVVADHGGATNTRGPEFVRVWLEDQGLQGRTDPGLRSRVLGGGFDLLHRSLPRERKLALARRFPRMRERAQAESRLAGIDWRGTSAYADGVRDEVLVNLAGREPDGVVPPDDYDRFLSDLQERIHAIRELDTGDPVVDSVRRRDEAYHGPFTVRAPDLTVRWRVDGPFRGFDVESAGALQRMRQIAARPPFQSGGHHPQGILVANGPDIRPGEVRGTLMDVTPTILALLGIPFPPGLDGRPLDILKHAEATAAATESDRGPQAGRTAETGAEAEPGGARTVEPGTGYTAEEEEAVRQRLEDLGYL